MNGSGAGFPRSSYLGESGGKRRDARIRKSATLTGSSARGSRTDREQWMLTAAPRPRQGSRGNSRGERHAVLEEEPESNTALIPDIEARAGIPGSGAQPANSERGFPRSHSGLTSATVPPRSVSTVTGWRQSSALLLIISLYGINIRI